MVYLLFPFDVLLLCDRLSDKPIMDMITVVDTASFPSTNSGFSILSLVDLSIYQS